jgi:hypothetical protein
VNGNDVRELFLKHIIKTPRPVPLACTIAVVCTANGQLAKIWLAWEKKLFKETQPLYLRFTVLTEASMKMRAFWDTTPRSLVEVD